MISVTRKSRAGKSCATAGGGSVCPRCCRRVAEGTEVTATADLIEAQKKYYRQLERAADLRAQAEDVESTAEEALANKIAYALDVQRVPLRQAWKALGWSNVKTKAWADRARKRNTELLRKGTN